MPMILSFAGWLSFAGTPVSVTGSAYKWGYTSKFSRMKQRSPAIEMSGPKAFVESLTPWRSSLAVTDGVDFQVDLFSFVAHGLLSEG